MAFHFTLEAVLRFRQSLEERELQRLQTLLARRAALFCRLEEWHQARLSLEERTKEAMLQRPILAVEIHFAMARLHALNLQQQITLSELRQLEVSIAEQRSRFEQQRRNREVLDVLRDVQLRDFRLLQRRREQAQLDELHLLRSKSGKHRPSSLSPESGR